MNDELRAAIVFSPTNRSDSLPRGSGPRREMRRNGLPDASQTSQNLLPDGPLAGHYGEHGFVGSGARTE